MTDEIINVEIIDGIIVISLIVDEEKKRIMLSAKAVLKLIEKL